MQRKIISSKNIITHQISLDIITALIDGRIEDAATLYMSLTTDEDKKVVMNNIINRYVIEDPPKRLLIFSDFMDHL